MAGLINKYFTYGPFQCCCAASTQQDHTANLACVATSSSLPFDNRLCQSDIQEHDFPIYAILERSRLKFLLEQDPRHLFNGRMWLSGIFTLVFAFIFSPVLGYARFSEWHVVYWLAFSFGILLTSYFVYRVFSAPDTLFVEFDKELQQVTVPVKNERGRFERINIAFADIRFYVESININNPRWSMNQTHIYLQHHDAHTLSRTGMIVLGKMCSHYHEYNCNAVLDALRVLCRFMRGHPLPERITDKLSRYRYPVA